MDIRAVFARIAQRTAQEAGRPWAFLLAVATILGWGVSGPFFGFSEDWQLVINTGTTIVTFLMVFLIQNAQNRDTQAIQLKLDELIRVTQGAHNTLIAVESQGEEVVAQVRAEIAEGCAADPDVDPQSPDRSRLNPAVPNPQVLSPPLLTPAAWRSE